VVVSSTLVERLDHDEAAAILAHELAHIEHHTSRRLRQARLVSYALVASIALLAPAVRHGFAQAFTAILIAWPLVLIVALARQARNRQKHETASDLRAIVLTGDPDALVRALTKLHALAHIPRRWDTEFERQASHPSSRAAFRLQAAARDEPPTLGEAAAFGNDGHCR
jgi:heat shock protein HtpX